MTIQIVGNGEVGIMADISIKELIEEMVQSDPHKIILSGGRGEYRKVVFERKIIEYRDIHSHCEWWRTR